ncbi:MAG: ATP-binding protein [Desulfomonilia bacterium]
MYLKKVRNLKDSLSVRLTFWYATIFILLSFLVLFIFYERVAFITNERMDQELLEEVQEFRDISAEYDVVQIKKEILLEVESEDQSEIFFRLFSEDGSILISSDMKQWGEIGISYDNVRTVVESTKPLIETIEVPGREYNARTVYSVIGPSAVLQIGQSLEQNEEYLKIFKKLIFLLVLPVFACAALLGWFMAKKALAGVDEVTQIASEISEGGYNKRVKVTEGSIEIHRLANTFNRMVDRLQVVIKEMREMTDNIAHDMRSPLARIRGSAEMILMGKNSKQDFEEMAISTIEECDNLISMINTMLDIAETEAGVREMKLEPVEMSRLVLDACELYRAVAQEKNITLNTITSNTMYFQGDKAMLKRMIVNLLDNAIKYTPSNGNVLVLAERLDETLFIRFEDAGIGIPASDLPKIFNRFYRCDRSRSRSGIGLGLSLTKAIAEAHGGSISVESIQGEGSVFTIQLPCSTPE